MRLHQRCVDVLCHHRGTLCAYRLDQTVGGQVYGVSEDAFTATGDQMQGSTVDAAVGQADTLELSQDKALNSFAGEFVQDR